MSALNPGPDSGFSSSSSDNDSDNEEEEKRENLTRKTKSVNSVETDIVNGEFTSPLPRDEVEVRYDGESFEVSFGEDIASECDRAEVVSDALCNTLGSHYAREYFGEEGLAALLVDTSNQGKPDDDDDDDPDSCSVSPIVDEEELIAQKTEFEQEFIREFRRLFSETLSHNRHLRAPPMKISIKDSPSRSRDPALYRFKPRPIPANIKPQAKGMMTQLESQGIIRRMAANEQSEFCAPSGFVPKKNGKLRFIIDFTALNKYVQRPVHSFPSSDQVTQAIKSTTTHIACVDFPSGYFQALLHPDSNLYLL